MVGEGLRFDSVTGLQVREMIRIDAKAVVGTNGR
jgi:hypothetical protein